MLSTSVFYPSYLVTYKVGKITAEVRFGSDTTVTCLILISLASPPVRDISICLGVIYAWGNMYVVVTLEWPFVFRS